MLVILPDGIPIEDEKKCFSTKNHGRAVFRLSLSFKNGVQSADGMGLGSTEWLDGINDISRFRIVRV